MVEYFSRFLAENEIQKTNEKHSNGASSNVFRNIAMNIEITIFSLNLTFFAIKFTIPGCKIFPQKYSNNLVAVEKQFQKFLKFQNCMKY